MNETLQTIADRYSCRDFTGAPLTQTQIAALVEAALAAPSGMNRQPWHILMVTDKALIDKLDAEGMQILAAAEDKSGYTRMMSRGGKMFYNAPCMMMVVSENPAHAAMDCGILSQNVALAAHALGLGNVICGMAGIPLSGPNGDALKKCLQFPDGYGFSIAILLGEANSSKEPHPLDKSKVTYIVTPSA